MTIWILLMLSVFQGALALATLNANAELRQISREIFRKHGMGIGAPVGCLIALAGVGNMTAWTVYAFQAGDWRFAAIPAVPFLVSWAGRALYSWAGKPQVRVSSDVRA